MIVPAPIPQEWPDHTQLPESDGTFVTNFQEHPQSLLLTDSILPVLQQLHPDGQFAIGQDSGIYWRLTDPPLDGCKAPDWYYVPGVPPLLDGRVRRSYVMWHEILAPLLVLEFVSGDGSEERDRTPWTGKFWVYENAIRPAYYGIYEVGPGRVEMYRRVGNQFELLPANEHGRFPINGLGVELGIWQGSYQGMELPWMRLWSADGPLLLIGAERAVRERERAEKEKERADQERERAEEAQKRAEKEKERAEKEKERAERLAARLRALGVDPEQEA